MDTQRAKLVQVVIHSADDTRRDWEELYKRIEAVKGPGRCVEGRVLRGEFRAEWPGVALRTMTLTTRTEAGTLTPVAAVLVVIGFESLEGAPVDCSAAAGRFPWPD